MVSNRCIAAVKEVMDKLRLHLKFVILGEAEVTEYITPVIHDQLKTSLENIGFELMEDKRSILVEKIKNTVIEMVHHSDEIIKVNFSDYLSEKLNYDYAYLANLFSDAEGTTIERFIIRHKIERIKELLIYNELNISEIAIKMNYSSVAHLSSQFKKVTGFSPSSFKKLKTPRRYPIEEIGN